MKFMKRGFLAIVTVVVLGGGVALGIHMGAIRPTTPSRMPTALPRPAAQPADTQSASTVKIYRVAVENDEPRLRPTELEVESGTKPEESALRLLIEQGDDADLTNPIPRGTRLLGLTLSEDLATVDLSREFRTRFSGGSEEEALIIGAILRTLGQFPEIHRVRLLVQGKPIESLGHLDLSEPLDVNSVGTGFGGGN